jgi:predicted transcriptional regulator
MKRHLAVFIGNAVEKILQGQKIVEARFSISKILPYESLMKDDEIFLKKSGGLVFGKVKVDNVLYYEGLDAEAIGKLRHEYQNDLLVGDKFWQEHANSKYATIIFLKNPERFLAPLKIAKRDRRSWMVL